MRRCESRLQADAIKLAVEQEFQADPAPFVANYEAESGQTGVTVTLVSATATGNNDDNPGSGGLSAVTIAIIAGASLVFLVVAGLAVRHFCGTSPSSGAASGRGKYRDDNGAQSFVPMTELTAVSAGGKDADPGTPGTSGSGSGSGRSDVAFVNPVSGSRVPTNRNAPLVGKGARAAGAGGQARGTKATKRKKKSSRERQARAYDDGL